MSYRILHLADLHLERAFAGMGCHGELARRRRQGLRDALRRAGETAMARRCDLVTIAGDLYEHERAGIDTARHLAETFESWQPLRVALAPGNHDALVPGSVYERTVWPPNVHLFTEPVLQPLQLEAGLVLWGLAHNEPRWLGDPLETASPPAGGDVHIALFHGAELAFRPAGASVHGPFHAERIRERGFTTALCGHYHRRRIDERLGLVYPGSPEPLTFDETGARGPVIVTIERSGAIAFEPLALNAWSAVATVCDLDGCVSPTAAADRISASALAAAAGLDPELTLVNVELQGEVPGDLALDVYSLESAVRESTGVATLRIRDLTRADLDAESVADERTARGAFVRGLRESIRADEEGPAETALLEDALRYGLQALSGREVGLR